MGDFQTIRPVMRFVAVFSGYPELIERTRQRLEASWGPVLVAGSPFPFHYTTYYEREMGPELTKVFWAFEEMLDPEGLPDWKRETNRLEVDLPQELGADTGADTGRLDGAFAVPRPVNIDPGYLTEAKLVLATTKDRDHRIYLRDGIFAEVTMHYHARAWQGRQWTYPDYADAVNIPFFDQCREKLRRRLRES